MTLTQTQKIAKAIVEDIMKDLGNRKGYGWHLVDDDVQQEIRDTWEDIAAKHIWEDPHG